MAIIHTFISGAIAYLGSYFGTRSSPSFITNVNCRGLPSRILDCSYSIVTATALCNQASDAGVMCIGKLVESILKMYACNFCMVYSRTRQLWMFQAWGFSYQYRTSLVVTLWLNRFRSSSTKFKLQWRCFDAWTSFLFLHIHQATRDEKAYCDHVLDGYSSIVLDLKNNYVCFDHVFMSYINHKELYARVWTQWLHWNSTTSFDCTHIEGI